MSTTKKNADTLTAAIGSIPLPSSDLIQYRFDQIDAKLEKFDQKLDMISSAYMPRHESDERYNEVMGRLRNLEDKTDKLRQTDDFQQGTIDGQRRLIGVGLTLLGIIVVAVSTYIGLHK